MPKVTQQVSDRARPEVLIFECYKHQDYHCENIMTCGTSHYTLQRSWLCLLLEIPFLGFCDIILFWFFPHIITLLFTLLGWLFFYRLLFFLIHILLWPISWFLSLLLYYSPQTKVYTQNFNYSVNANDIQSYIFTYVVSANSKP